VCTCTNLWDEVLLVRAEQRVGLRSGQLTLREVRVHFIAIKVSIVRLAVGVVEPQYLRRHMKMKSNLSYFCALLSKRAGENWPGLNPTDRTFSPGKMRAEWACMEGLCRVGCLLSNKMSPFFMWRFTWTRGKGYVTNEERSSLTSVQVFASVSFDNDIIVASDLLS